MFHVSAEKSVAAVGSVSAASKAAGASTLRVRSG